MHAFGYDVARKGDPAIAHLLAIDRMLTRRSALTVELRNVPFAEQKAICTDILHAAPRLVGAAIDATGLGMNLAEDLGREFGLSDGDLSGGLVCMISFSQGWYNENMPPLKVAFEDGTIALAKDAEHVSDLRHGQGDPRHSLDPARARGRDRQEAAWRLRGVAGAGVFRVADAVAGVRLHSRKPARQHQRRVRRRP
jgi:phage FluMu gp28-like protein